MSTPTTATKNRTNHILLKFKGMDDEFVMLKGLLIACHGMESNDSKVLEKAFSGGMIAARLDELIAVRLDDAVKS